MALMGKCCLSKRPCTAMLAPGGPGHKSLPHLGFGECVIQAQPCTNATVVRAAVVMLPIDLKRGASCMDATLINLRTNQMVQDLNMIAGWLRTHLSYAMSVVLAAHASMRSSHCLHATLPRDYQRSTETALLSLRFVLAHWVHGVPMGACKHGRSC